MDELNKLQELALHDKVLAGVLIEGMVNDYIKNKGEVNFKQKFQSKLSNKFFDVSYLRGHFVRRGKGRKWLSIGSLQRCTLTKYGLKHLIKEKWNRIIECKPTDYQIYHSLKHRKTFLNCRRDYFVTDVDGIETGRYWVCNVLHKANKPNFYKLSFLGSKFCNVNNYEYKKNWMPVITFYIDQQKDPRPILQYFNLIINETINKK